MKALKFTLNQLRAINSLLIKSHTHYLCRAHLWELSRVQFLCTPSTCNIVELWYQKTAGDNVPFFMPLHFLQHLCGRPLWIVFHVPASLVYDLPPQSLVIVFCVSDSPLLLSTILWPIKLLNPLLVQSPVVRMVTVPSSYPVHCRPGDC